MGKAIKIYPKTVGKGITQRGEYSFRVKIMRGGNLISKTFDTLADAKIFRDLTLAHAAIDPHEQATFEARAKKIESKTFAFAEAVEKYRAEKSEKKKGWKQEAAALNKILRWPDAAMPLYQIKPSHIIALLDWIKSSGRKSATGADLAATTSEATQKRYFNLIRHIFEVAASEWHKIDSNPCSAIPRSARPVDGHGRDRRLRGDEYNLMLAELEGEAKIIFILAVETAMRRGEIMGMRWENLDLKGRWLLLPSGTTKTNAARSVPLSKAAVEAFQSLTRGIRGKIITITPAQLRRAWKRAREAIGAPDLRMHDLRHEATSRMFEAGMGDIETASVTGHQTMSMLKRYAHIKHSHILDKLDRAHEIAKTK